MTKLHQLAELGQSIWLDYIQREFILSGELEDLIDKGLRGMTSNPTIFEKAIAGSQSYQKDLEGLVKSGKSVHEIYLDLVVDDIRRAADALRPVYDATNGLDGFVSLEANPLLARDTEATIAEVRHLWAMVDRPNLMVKIPATLAGLPAITEAISEGINVNVTLIFSLARYGEVIAAYIKGLEMRAQAGQPIDNISSVASFFVSRVDTKVDKLLDALIEELDGAEKELAESIRGQAGVANARIAYRQFQEVFEGEMFAELREKGARLQRPLWASTSTKDPAYSDVKYVEELIGPHTVNTLPEKTIDAFLDHGEVRPVLPADKNQPLFVMQSLESLGISMQEVTKELEDEGVDKFAASFESLMNTIRNQRNRLKPEKKHLAASLSSFKKRVEPSLALDQMEQENAIGRIYRKDYRLWKPEPKEIANRLGWLDTADEMSYRMARINAFMDAVRADGYTNVLLLGMGGSSLAPEVFYRTFGDLDGLRLDVLDSTDPEAVLHFQETLDPTRTLFIVSTKSGGTVETLSFFKYFYNWVAETLMPEGEVKRSARKQIQSEVGQHFAAITDPGSKLVELAEEYEFREIFLNNPEIGGRYSALSYFGLVPAALVGVNVPRLLDNAIDSMRNCGPDVPARENPAALLGVILGESALNGRDKVTFILGETIASFGEWLEQLIAESTGKEGKGILPVVGEPLGPPAVYGDDRLFVHIKLANDRSIETDIENLEDSGQPVIRIPLEDRYDLGGQFFLWEMATAVAGYRMDINPFDQPNVEMAKQKAREMVAAYKETGKLPAQTPLLSQSGLEIYGQEHIHGAETEWNMVEIDSPAEALAAFLSQAREGDYIALQAFFYPDTETDTALQRLRAGLRDQYHLATTLGYGPRFLHSTGQLHKGDRGNGLFLQFTSPASQDVGIPDVAGEEESSISFDVLKLAQALGDMQALEDAGRRVLRIHILTDRAASIRQLRQALD